MCLLIRLKITLNIKLKIVYAYFHRFLRFNNSMFHHFFAILSYFPLKLVLNNRILTILVVLIGVPAFLLLVNVVARKVSEPHKTWMIHFLNSILYLPMILKLGPYKKDMNIHESCKSAVKRTKLDDFGGKGGKSFLRNYELILKSECLKNQTFNPLGYFIAQKEITDTMKARLKRCDFFKRYPESLDVEVKRPIFVIGLPRTGTTFFHRLLSLNPTCRAPLTWELLSPTPLNVDDLTKDRAKRRRKMDANLQQMKSVGGGILANIHEVGTDLPEECLVSLTHDLPCLLSLMFACFVNHEEFLEMETFSAYENYKDVLRMLSWQIKESGKEGEKDPRQWVLKSPMHLLFVDAIVNAFPDAIIVWTHRFPLL